MSETIDNRVVSMQFDNKNFEKNASQTMSTIDKLKEKLNFKGVEKSFDSIEKASKNVKLDVMSNSVDKVKMAFSALDVFAVTALTRISNTAITTGENLVKAFTIDPVKSGLNEYETQINAVQTILANTSHQGTTIRDVNEALDELNHYADMTIYNFTEMTRNIGTFTAAGLDLETSVKGIQGIANLAAVSGSNAQQASTAMSQLSQALAAGSVHLQDWNSVVNAGMGGKVFQDAIIQTAKEMGALNDVTLKAYESGTSFRELLNAKDYGNWFSSDVLAQALSKFTKSGAVEYMSQLANVSQTSMQDLQNLGDKVGYNSKEFKKMALSIANGDKAMAKNITSTLSMASTATDAATKVKTATQLFDTLAEAAQSGWTQTWELIIGDFEEAKALFTEASDYFSNIINESANKRNELVQGAMQNLVSSEDWTKLKDAGIASKAFKNALIETAETNGVAVKQMIKDNGSFEASLKNGWLTKDVLNQTLKKNEKQLSSSTLKMTKSMKKYLKVSEQVMKGSWGKGAELQEKLAKAGYDYSQVQNMVNNMTKYGTKDFEKMCIAQLKSEGVSKKQAKALVELAKEANNTNTPLSELVEKMERPSGRELLIDTLRNSIKAIVKPITAMKKAWREVFPATTSEDLYNIINTLHDFSAKIANIDRNGSKLTRTFKGLFSIVKIVSTLIGGGFKLGLSIVQAILGNFNLDILDVTASIGDFISNAEKWIEKNNYLGKGIEFVASVITTAINLIGALAEKIGEMPNVQNAIEGVSDFFTNMSELGFDKFQEAIDRIDYFIDKIKRLDSITLDDIIDIFKDFKENVIDYILDVDARVDDIKEGFATLRDNLSKDTKDGINAIGFFKDSIIEFASSVKDKLGGFDIFGAILTIGALKTVKSASNALEKLGSAIEKLAAPIEEIKNLIPKFGKVLKAYAFNLRSEGILNIAKAIAILAGSLALLTQVDSKKLLIAAGALTIMTVALAGLSVAISKLNLKDVGKMSVNLLAIAGSVLALSVALKVMSGLNTKKMFVNIAAIGVLIAGITAFGLVGSKIKAAKGSMATVLAFAISLRILVNALQKLDGMNFKQLSVDLTAIVGIIGTLSLVSKASGKSSFTNGAGMLLMVVSLRMFLKTLASLSEFDYTAIQNNLSTIIIVIATYRLLLKASEKAGENAAKAGAMMLGISTSMIILVKAIKKMSQLKTDEIQRAKGTITQMLLVFGAVMMMSKFSGENAAKAGVMIMSMSTGLMAISVVAAILSRLDPDGLARATASISIILGCFGLIVAASGLSKDCKANLAIMTAAITMLAVAVGTLSFVEPEKLQNATMGISMLLGSFALLVASTRFAKSANKQLIVMTGVIALLGSIIAAVSAFSTDNAISASASISILLTSLSASLLILSKTQEVSKNAIIGLYAISGAVGVLAIILGTLSALDVQPSIETAGALSVMLLSMAGVCKILSELGPVSSAALKGALILDGVIGIIGAFIIGVGALSDNFESLQTFANKGIELLNTIGRGLGEFIGNFVGGIAKGTTDELPAIGQNLTDFANKISTVDPRVAESAKTLASVLLTLGSAELINAITSWITGGVSMDDFSTQLSSFGKGIADFSKAVDGKVNPEAITTATQAAKGIIELAQMIPNSGGVVGFFAGNNDIEDFAPQMVTLGKGIVQFSNTVSKGKIQPNKISASITAGKGILELAAMIPNQGGVISFFAGDNNIEDFAPQIVKLGKGIKQYSDAVSKGKLRPDKVNASVVAAKGILELAAMIPNQGGVISFFAGDNNIEDFAPQLTKLADGIVAFSDSVSKGINISAIKNANDAGKQIIELAIKMGESSEELYAMAKNDKYTEIGQNLKELGDSMSSMATSSLGLVSTEAARKVYYNMSQFIGAAKLVTQVNGSQLSKVPSTFNQLSKISVDKFVNNFINAKSKVKSAISSMLSTAESTIRNRYTSFVNAGNHCVSGFVNGILSKVNSGDVYSAGEKIGNEALRGARKSLDIHSPSRKMKKVAEHTVNGFTNYINQNGSLDAFKSGNNMSNSFLKSSSKIGNKIKVAAQKTVDSFTSFINGGGKKNVQTATNNTINQVGNSATKTSKKNISKHANSVTKTATKSATKTVKKVSEAFQNSMQKELKKVKKDYKSVSDISKILDKKMGTFVKKASKVTNTIKYSADVVNSFTVTYLSSVKNIKTRTDKAASSVAKYIKRLYEESDAYKTDQSNLKELLKTRKQYYKEEVRIVKKLSKVKDVSQKKQLQQQLKETKKNIKKVNKEINNVQKTITKNMTKTFTDFKKSIKTTLKDYMSIFSITKETINLFDFSVLDDITDDYADMKLSVSDSLSSMVSILDISLSNGLDILSKFSDGTEELANSIADAEKELADAQKEVADAQKEYDDAEKEYTEAMNKSNSVFGRSERYLENVKSTYEKLTSAQEKLTSATEKQTEAQQKLNDLKTDTSVKDMLDNMKSNLDGMKEYRKALEDLSNRPINKDLLKYLESLGISGMDQIKTFVKMTDEELKTAGEYYTEFNKQSTTSILDGIKDKKEAMTGWGDSMKKFMSLDMDKTVKEALLSEFQEQGVDSAEYINAILAMSKDELKEFSSSYLEILKTPDDVANQIISARKKVDKETKKETGVDDYITVMKANIEAQKKYDNSISKLQEKVKKGLINEDFFNYLKSLGVDSVDVIDSFVNASDDKLKEANSLYAESAKIAGNSFIDQFGNTITDVNKWEKNLEAFSKLNIPAKYKDEIIKECVAQGVDSNPLLETILGFSDNQLKEFIKKYKAAAKEAVNGSNRVVANLVKTSNDANKKLKKKTKIESGIYQPYKNAYEKIEDGGKATAIKVGKDMPKHAIDSLVKTFNDNFPGVHHVVENLSTDVMSTMSTKMSSKNNEDISKKACNGLKTGITSSTNTVVNAAYNMASRIVDTIKNKLSELKDMQILSDLDNIASTKHTDISMKNIKDSVMKVASAAQTHSSYTPTIRPVLDMSSVNNSVSGLNNTINSNALSTNLASAYSLVSKSNNLNKGQNGRTVNNYDSSQHTIENHFNITGDNPKEIANEVSRILQNQIDRRSATWG